MVLVGSCHCRRVDVTLSVRPEYINDCNCTLCRKSGAIWGYYHREQVVVNGKTETYRRVDREKPIVNIHFCKTCGVTTHWSLTKFGRNLVDDVYRMGVNMHLFDQSSLAGVEMRFPNRADWQGGPEFKDVKPPEIL